MHKISQTIRTLSGLFPLTLQGTICLLVAAAALRVFGYGAMDLIVFALAICTLAIIIFCLFNTVSVGVLLQGKIRRQLEQATASGSASQRIEVEAGYPNESGFTLAALSYVPLVRLTWQVVYPDATETRTRSAVDGSLYEEIIPQQRCLSDQIIRQFSVFDVLGFCRFTWRQKQDAAIRALPQINTVKQLPLLRSLTAEDGIPNPSGDPEGDRMEIRPYAPGDSVKNIMWKVFARNRQLNVRLPENSVFQSNRTIAYLLSSDNDEAAAAIARVALESGALGEDWCFCADGSEKSCTSLPEALDAVARSRAMENKHHYGLDNFLNREAAQAGVHCIVFASAADYPWLAALKSTVANFRGQFSLVLATDGLEAKAQARRWQKFLFRDLETVPGKGAGPATAANPANHKVRDLLTELGQLVESTLIIDRRTGLSFDQHLRRV